MKRITKILLGAGAAIIALGAAGVCAVACGGPVLRPDGGTGLLPVGAMAPDVVGHDAQGHDVHLSGVRGSPAVVYFYPQDETPGCTKEACAFRDSFARLAAAHVTVFGVSRDDAESHKKFAANHSLPFPLVSDVSGDVEKEYGVPDMLGMSKRVSFLIGPDGHVTKVWPDVDPAIHADEVIAAVGTK